MEEGDNHDVHHQFVGHNTPFPNKKKKKLAVIGSAALLLFFIGGVHWWMKERSAVEEVRRDTPNGEVVALIPREPEKAENIIIPEIIRDEEGREYITGELIVVFRSSVSIDNAKAIIEREGGVVKQHFTALPVFLVGWNEEGKAGIMAAIKQFQALPEVEKAEPNYLTTAQ